MKVLAGTKMLTRLILVLTIGCVMGFPGCVDKSEKLTIEVFKKRGKLVVLTEPFFVPYEYYGDGSEIVGVDMEIAQLIANKLGVKLDRQKRSFDGLFSALSANDGDIVMAGITLDERSEGKFPHSEPYADACQRIVVSNDCDDIGEFKDLAGKKVGVPIATSSATYMQKALEEDKDGSFKDTPPTVEQFENNFMLIKALSNKHVDAVLLDSDTAEIYAQKDPNLKVLSGLIGKEEYVFLYAKNMSDEVISLINKIITEIKADGRLEEFRAKHRLANAGGNNKGE
ncbi:basic amino acid ABC transporter substrate-binding protein [Clostridia bacterium]|nr:basic amino acid ABC transporter substrate-binding protein [Clostridia bacterium]